MHRKTLCLWIFSSLFVLSLSDCAFFGVTKSRERNFNKVEVGQSSSQVLKEIGKPRSKTPEGDQEVWEYLVLSRSRETYRPYRLFFKEGRLAQILFDTDKALKLDQNESPRPGNEPPTQCVDAYGLHSQMAGDDTCDGFPTID